MLVSKFRLKQILITLTLNRTPTLESQHLGFSSLLNLLMTVLQRYLEKVKKFTMNHSLFSILKL